MSGLTIGSLEFEPPFDGETKQYDTIYYPTAPGEELQVFATPALERVEIERIVHYNPAAQDIEYLTIPNGGTIVPYPTASENPHISHWVDVYTKDNGTRVMYRVKIIVDQFG